MSESELPYEVGYGRPPKASQFQKGASGNPKGRPKGAKNLSTIVMKESRQRVRVNGPGGSRTVTKLEASVMQLTNKAAQGELRAMREYLNLVGRSEEELQSASTPLAIDELDQRTMESLRRRMAAIKDQTVTDNQNQTTEEE